MDTGNPALWNQLYQTDKYVFGKGPNHYLKEKLRSLAPGQILLPGEGEGRNAVYCAQQGWETFAFDFSETGKMKAEKLAKEVDVSIDYRVGNVSDIHYQKGQFDALALIFSHFVPEKRRAYHRQLAAYLKQDGVLILEGFARPEVITTDIRYDLHEIAEDFPDFEFSELRVKTEILHEGLVIQGPTEVLQAFGIKK